MLVPKVTWLLSGRLGSNSSTSVSGWEQERESMGLVAHWPLSSDRRCTSEQVPRRVLMEAVSVSFSRSVGLWQPSALMSTQVLGAKGHGVQRQAPTLGRGCTGRREHDGSIGLGCPRSLLEIVQRHCD